MSNVAFECSNAPARGRKGASYETLSKTVWYVMIKRTSNSLKQIYALTKYIRAVVRKACRSPKLCAAPENGMVRKRVDKWDI